jgi:hypothetical protein
MPPRVFAARSSDNAFIKSKLGWEPSTPLRTGLEKTYRWIFGEMKAADRKMLLSLPHPDESLGGCSNYPQIAQIDGDGEKLRQTAPRVGAAMSGRDVRELMRWNPQITQI